MEFAYPLAGMGWSVARPSDRATEATVTASCFGDALGALLKTVGTGAQGTRCSWGESPAEYRWIFARHGDLEDQRMLAVSALWGEQRDGEAGLVLETRQGLRGTAAALADGAADVRAMHGEGHLTTWVEAPLLSADRELVRQLPAPQ